MGSGIRSYVPMIAAATLHERYLPRHPAKRQKTDVARSSECRLMNTDRETFLKMAQDWLRAAALVEAQTTPAPKDVREPLSPVS